MTTTSPDDGGLAFPAQITEKNTGPRFFRGMTLRDYFAGQAIHVAVTAMRESGSNPATIVTGAAQSAYRIADAMIAARKV